MIRNIFRKMASMAGFSVTRIIVLGFMIVILVGAGLLCLPISTRTGESASFLTALFTATSATCVTGLVVKDTFLYWSVFGQIIIILLIQIGGLGFMTVATLFSLLLRRTISLKERLLISESIGIDSTAGVVRITILILLGTLIFEGVGAVILAIRFIPEFGWASGIYKGVFHAVSAFCNAGFDLMGEKGEFSSLMTYVGDWVVNLTIMSLIIIGGLGFAVWEDVFRTRSWRKLSLHSKIVIIITATLIVGGTLLILALEHSNDKTMGAFGWGTKILASMFQSVTPRTAGYNTIDQVGMTSATTFIVIILMFIGGSSGSTAGGVKTGTVGILVFAAIATVRGNHDINTFNRRIDKGAVLRALTVVMVAILIVAVGIILISIFEPDVNFEDIVFETVSAFATVGLTKSLTPTLSAASKLVLILLMYTGRVGVLTLMLSMIQKSGGERNCVRYPKGKVFV